MDLIPLGVSRSSAGKSTIESTVAGPPLGWRAFKTGDGAFETLS
jgi:hypothetical protein